jgi:hypothetical protein
MRKQVPAAPQRNVVPARASGLLRAASACARPTPCRATSRPALSLPEVCSSHHGRAQANAVGCSGPPSRRTNVRRASRPHLSARPRYRLAHRLHPPTTTTPAAAAALRLLQADVLSVMVALPTSSSNNARTLKVRAHVALRCACWRYGREPRSDGTLASFSRCTARPALLCAARRLTSAIGARCSPCRGWPARAPGQHARGASTDEDGRAAARG